MRLQNIIIDGFKSYAHRQELDGLDPHFNAITGLNGSGKSNIFDAICFVMGISNLKKVRAEDPRELIFKNGNAGIQRAAVTIEFRNDDRATAPPGYPCDEFPVITISRQILTGGRQKFFINNHVAEQTKVKQFFHSISLNVDNPHFMVLQGTVHKLVNMRPAEIMSWLEEAAGTRVFDARRRAAEHMIASKERKLAEINKTLDAEIGPMLTAMKLQQDEYANFVRVVEGLDAKRKFRTAFHFWVAQRKQNESTAKMVALKDTIFMAQTTLRTLPGAQEEATKRVHRLEEERDGPTAALKELHEQESEKKKDEAKCKSQIQALEKNIRAVEKAIKALELERAQNQNQLDKFLVNDESNRAAFMKMKDERHKTEEAISKLKESHRLLTSGIQASDNGVSVAQERDQLKRALVRLDGELQRNREHLENTEKDVAELSRRVDASSGDVADLARQVEAARQNVARCEERFAPFQEIEKQILVVDEKLRVQHDRHRAALDELSRSNGPAPILDYRDVPGYDFDALIYGRVGELVTVMAPEYSRALTVGAGTPNLMRVIIQDDKAVQVLIRDGQLQQRTAFFPLNTVQRGGVVEGARWDEAVRIAKNRKGSVVLPTTLIQYNARLSTVMERVFGTFVICSDLELAKELALGSAKIKAVTMDGDVVEPSGIVSGGSANAVRDFLSEFGRYAEKKRPIASLKEEMKNLQQQRRALEAERFKGQPARKALEDAEVQLQGLTHRQSSSVVGDTMNRLAELQATCRTLKERIQKYEGEKENCHAKLKDVEARAVQDPRKVGKEIQDKIKHAQQRLKELDSAIAAEQEEFDRLEEKKGELEQKAQGIVTDHAEKSVEVQGMKEELLQLQKTFADIQEASKRLAQETKKQLELSANLTNELTDATEEVRKLKEQEDSLQKVVKDGELEIKTASKTLDELKRNCRDLQRQYDWIAAEMDSFGPTDGAYYFEDDVRTAATLKELEENEALSEAMGRKVNKKATMMYDQCQKEYNELLEKRSTLVCDKDVILATIQAVEQRKWATLDKMVKKVSEGFSTLFAACLPGAECRLVEERSEETGRLTGLVVKVSFSGKEKESLTELSGGQRSLLALCLILAILRFRPAPVYILDEVDAALDPSHTQNIGRMLQEHFRDAQFLLVSLKDGMFNNANVLYQIRNTQGFSEISRRAARQ